MKQPVIRKQPNSRMCVICGTDNPHSLVASFYEIASGELVALATPRDEHQSYPGRLHGGMIAALLDETIGRAILARHGEAVWGVTVEFTTRYLKPVPLGAELRIVGRITAEDGRTFHGTGEILLPTGDVAATGVGKYVRLPIERIADFDPHSDQWHTVASPDDPVEIEVGESGLTASAGA